jgi:hypothetical protein
LKKSCKFCTLFPHPCAAEFLKLCRSLPSPCTAAQIQRDLDLPSPSSCPRNPSRRIKSHLLVLRQALCPSTRARCRST